MEGQPVRADETAGREGVTGQSLKQFKSQLSWTFKLFGSIFEAGFAGG
jgi:hypothetical protein